MSPAHDPRVCKNCGALITRKPYTLPTIRAAMQAVREGQSMAHVARAIGAPHSTVAGWCRARGVRSAWRGNSRYTPEIAAACVAAVRAGASTNEAARGFGVARNTVQRWCAAEGVTTRYPWPWNPHMNQKPEERAA